MKIRLEHIAVRDLFDGYQDNGENGVVAYGGKLDVRPAYQREFIYDPQQQQAVIDTLSKGYPLNVMYWSDQGDGRYELIDGQQRTLSICTFLNNDFPARGSLELHYPNRSARSARIYRRSSMTTSSPSIYARGRRARSSNGSGRSILLVKSLPTKSYATLSILGLGYQMPSATSVRRGVQLTDWGATISREQLTDRTTLRP